MKVGIVEIREYPSRMVIEASYTDETNPRRMPVASVLPEHIFSTSLQLKGKAKNREEYITTSPVEVCTESLEMELTKKSSRLKMDGSSIYVTRKIPVKRSTWRVPLPSHIGRYSIITNEKNGDQRVVVKSTLPELIEHPTEENEGLQEDIQISDMRTKEYKFQPKRKVAVLKMKCDPQGENYFQRRKDLLEFVKDKLGYETAKNPETQKSRVWVYQHGLKVGFNVDGQLGMAAYEQSKYSKSNEIVVELV